MKTIFKAMALCAGLAIAGEASAKDFVGERIELRTGGDFVHIANSQLKTTLTEKGGDFGISAGWDFRLFKGVVAGAEFTSDFDTGKKCGTSGLSSGGQTCLNLIRSLSAAARIGGKVSNTILLYGKAGYASGRIHAVYSSSGTNYFNQTANNEGWIFGGGVEWAAWQNTYLKLEYDYSTYGGSTYRSAARTAVGVRF